MTATKKRVQTPAHRPPRRGEVPVQRARAKLGKGGRRCTVCDHPHRSVIDRLLASNKASLRDIAGRHGLSKSSVERHLSDHVPLGLIEAATEADLAIAIGTLEQMRELNATTLDLLERLDDADDLEVALKGVREVRGNLELISKLTGELKPATATTVNVNVINAPDWAATDYVLATLWMVTQASTLFDAKKLWREKWLPDIETKLLTTGESR